MRQVVAPLQEHSRTMWTLVNMADDIWLSNRGLDTAAVDAATHVLFGVEGIEKPSGKVCPLYKRKHSLRDQIRQEMPTFDVQGLGGRRATSGVGRGGRDGRG